MDLNGTLVEAKICTQMSQVLVLAATSVPFRPMTMQMPNLALIETKRIAVYFVFVYFVASIEALT